MEASDENNVDKLVLAITTATKHVYEELRRLHPGHYYYFTLITTGEGHPPVVSAWSYEALEEATKHAIDREDAIWGLKWSYADSPYFAFGEANFEYVKQLFAQRPDIRYLEGYDRQQELLIRLGTMEKALQELNTSGLFGAGLERDRILINVEVMPPDQSNTERALRLNPPGALEQWLDEAAE